MFVDATCLNVLPYYTNISSNVFIEQKKKNIIMLLGLTLY